MERLGAPDDEFPTIEYDCATGTLRLEAPAGIELTTLDIFLGTPHQEDCAEIQFDVASIDEICGDETDWDCDALFAVCRSCHLFQLRPDGGLEHGDCLGTVLPPGLSAQQLMDNLTLDGSRLGGGAADLDVRGRGHSGPNCRGSS